MEVRKIEIPLRKRWGKLVLYCFFTVLLSLVLVFTSPSLFEKPFNWRIVAGFLLVVAAFSYIAGSVYNGIRIKNPMLVAAIVNGRIAFYIRHANGTANESRELDLDSIARFYVVRTRSRFMISDLSFECVRKQGYLRERIDVIPELYELDRFDIPKVLEFISNEGPHISIGYDGGILGQVLRK